MTEKIVPNPRQARRQSWDWGDDVLGVCDNGDSWTAAEVRHMDWPTPTAVLNGRGGRWLQLDGNRFVILVDDDAEHPTEIWYSPISLLREHIVSAVERERAAIASGTMYPMKTVVVTNVGGRKLARRAWSWRTRNRTDAATEWIDATALDWETYCAATWPKTPAPRDPIPMEQAA